jgi:O-antigen ligase
VNDEARAELPAIEPALTHPSPALTSALWRRAAPAALFALIAGFYLLPSNREVNKLFYFLVLPIAFATARLHDYRRFWQDPVTRTALLFVGYLCVSGLWSGASEDAAEAVWHGLNVLSFLLLIVVARDRMRIDDALLRGLAALTAAHAVVVMAAWYSSHPFGDRMLGLGRLDQPLQLASVQAAVGAAAAMAFMSDKEARSRWLALVTALCGLAILLTASRGPLLALVAIILGSALWLRTRRALAMSTAIVVLGAGALIAIPTMLDTLLARGMSFRPEIWAAAWERIDDAWLLGHGLGAPGTVITVDGTEFRHLHSIVLMAWYYGGIVAVMALLAMVGTTIHGGIKAASAHPWLAAFAAGFLCQLPNGDTPLIHPHPVWLYLWLPLAMVAVPRVRNGT